MCKSVRRERDLVGLLGPTCIATYAYLTFLGSYSFSITDISSVNFFSIQSQLGICSWVGLKEQSVNFQHGEGRVLASAQTCKVKLSGTGPPGFVLSFQEEKRDVGTPFLHLLVFCFLSAFSSKWSVLGWHNLPPCNHIILLTDTLFINLHNQGPGIKRQ